MRPVFIEDCELIEPDSDVLFMKRLEKSVQLTCKHAPKECVRTSESGSDTAFVSWYCKDCKLTWIEEMTGSAYRAWLATEFPGDAA